MQQYDAVLKRILMDSTPAAISQLTGFPVLRWLNTEMPEVRSPRVDLLGEAPGQTLVHIELQSTNDPAMARRMLQYALAIYSAHGRRPEQVVLYTGEDRLRMSGSFAEFGYSCRIVDIREYDPEPLLASPSLADNVITILMKHRDQRALLIRVLDRIAAAAPEERPQAFSELMILAGLRRIAPITIAEEVKKMPILNDIMDHEFLGPKLRAALAEGRHEGERELFLRLIARRFGSLPAWAANRIQLMTNEEIEAAADRLLDADSLDTLLGGST